MSSKPVQTRQAWTENFPRASLPQFIDSVDDVVEYSVEAEEQLILDTYEPTTVYESDSDADSVPDVPIISYKTALEGLEPLGLFRFQNPQLNL